MVVVVEDEVFVVVAAIVAVVAVIVVVVVASSYTIENEAAISALIGEATMHNCGKCTLHIINI